jgi:4-alpha-glucanotransferase
MTRYSSSHVAAPELFPRSAGFLLHPTSLPGRGPAGDIGPTARAFVDWIARAGGQLWQVLPLVPPGAADSPYASSFALCGSPWLISLDDLVQDGLLSQSEAMSPSEVVYPSNPSNQDHCDFEAMRAWKGPLLDLAARRLVDTPGHPLHWLLSRLLRQDWAQDAAQFTVLRRKFGRPWTSWPAGLRDHDPHAIQQAVSLAELAPEVALQALFVHQWQRLHDHAKSKGVRLVGDVPIYVDLDSADVWAARHLFQLDRDLQPLAVAGVPPDYFSALGQLWGNPLYDWEAMARDGFRWWQQRLRRVLHECDLVRLDHFRGFSAYWAVPFGADDARSGQWRPGPGLRLFATLRKAMGPLPLIAEDLGDVDRQVEQLRDTAQLPGMTVLQFGFGNPSSHPFLPHNHKRDRVVYTGTHDNDTAAGWWANTPAVRAHVQHYFGIDGHDIAWDMIRHALQSVAHTAIVPVQDVLGLGSDARLNVPGVSKGNWSWRLKPGQLTEFHAERFRGLCALYGR